MASDSSPPGPPPGIPFDPLNQTSSLLYADGVTPIPFNTHFITELYMQATSLSILYGSQIGACFMMLCVVLAMTPRARFRRLPTLISVAALALNLVRMVLLAVFFTTTWIDLYVLVSQDAAVVPRSDFDVSAAATVLSVPVTVLILAALGVQAWSMTRLWAPGWKLPAYAVSALLIAATVTFNTMTTIVQTRAILYADISRLADWVRKMYLILITTSICWFCFLFNIRLVMHMWTNRSILPSLKGLKAMDVLVITNGILMFVPVIFSALEFGNWKRFEPASLTQTSVIIVLPLGTLVAQRLANPAWFGTAGGDSAGSSTAMTSLSAPRGAAGGGAPTATTASAASRRPLLMSARRSSGAVRDSVHRGDGHGRAGVTTYIAADAAASDASDVSEKGRAVHAEGDGRVSEDLERGNGGGGVRVGYGIERTEERAVTGSS